MHVHVDVFPRAAPVDYMMASTGYPTQYQDASGQGSFAQGMMGQIPPNSVWGAPARNPQYTMLSRQIIPSTLPIAADVSPINDHLLMGPSGIMQPEMAEVTLRGKPISLDHAGMGVKCQDNSTDQVVSGNPVGMVPSPATLTVIPATGADSTASGNTVVTSRVVESPTVQTTPVAIGRRQSKQRNSGTRGEGIVNRRRSSKYRGVTKHRRSGRWEAHIWIKDIGRQVYLGGYEIEEHAAEAYDVAALKCKGRRVKTNFEITRYADLLKCMDSISLEELIMAVRRQSQGFSRGTSSYRGVTHHPSGRWESRIGIPGSKHIYLGLYDDEKEAARQYDRALVRLRGTAAATNFALSDYREELAEYHQMQQAVLLRDASAEAAMRSGPNFEHWIKFGSKGSDLLSLEFGSKRPEALSIEAGSPTSNTNIKSEEQDSETPTSQKTPV
ncbi:hypothetical protein BSKO_04202 [Bryopsis sp. KO-2023]|nr:hypothetical protein BSKO_04202 [Bryopsis sp. KO-2023]